MAILSIVQKPAIQKVIWTLNPSTTVGRAVNAATQRLAEAGIDTARLDAQVILAYALGVSRSWLYAHFEDELDATQRETFTELIARRIAHEPVAYLVGRKEFYGIELEVDACVLIPRPETEMLVDAVLYLAADVAPTCLMVADVGTGSGAIALAVAANAPNTRLFAIDLSADALAVAAANVARLDERGQVTLLRGDLLSPLPAPVDVVVANLPYVASADYAGLEPDVRVYEPQLALEAGPLGLDAITRLLRQLPGHLCPGGSVVLEIGYNQGQQVVELIETLLPQARDIEVRKDYQGHARTVSFVL